MTVFLILKFKFESIVSENVGVMLGLRAKLPTPPPEAVTVFYEDCWKEILTPHPTSNMPNEIYIPTSTQASASSITVELQWLEHLWDYENLFETGVDRAIEGLL